MRFDWIQNNESRTSKHLSNTPVGPQVNGLQHGSEDSAIRLRWYVVTLLGSVPLEASSL